MGEDGELPSEEEILWRSLRRAKAEQAAEGAEDAEKEKHYDGEEVEQEDDACQRMTGTRR
jgi:hypothetical protein